MRFKESNELASDIVGFFSKFKEQFNINQLAVNIDCADPGFISQINTTASKQRSNKCLVIGITYTRFG